MNLRESFVLHPSRNVSDSFVALREGSPDQPRDERGRWSGGGHPDQNHPIYNTPQKSKGYTSKVSPISADYHTAGRMLRQRMPAQDKGGHLAAGDDLAQTARKMDVDHAALTKRALASLKRKGVDPGSLISGVVSDKFGDKTKNELRRLAHGSSAASSAAMAHFAAARKKIDTARQRLRKEKYEDWDKTTRQPKFS